MTKKWTDELVARLKSQKARTEQQELIVLLHEKTDRTQAIEIELRVLIKAERAKERSRAAAVAATKLLGIRNDIARKERNHRLIQQGLLIDLAGLTNKGRGEMLGGLLALAQSKPESWASWKQAGDVLLARKENEMAKDKVNL